MASKPSTYSLEEQVPTPFDFRSTIQAHGWVVLRPFEWHEPTAALSRIHRLETGKVVQLHLHDGNKVIRIEIDTVSSLTTDEETEIRQSVRRMLRLDEGFEAFHQLSKQLNGQSLALKPGSGRLLRCPRLFEDIIYTLCTTNIAWSGTKRMVDRLVAKLGDPFMDIHDQRAFPTAEAIAAAGTDFLKQETGLGYRSAYVWELATAIVEGQVDLDAFEDQALPTDELYRMLRQIKGVGDYAASTILMLLGHYDRLAIDSEMRAFVSTKYFDNQPASNDQIQAIYAPWGRWQYLAYWFESLSN